jgi:hypothetical protein
MPTRLRQIALVTSDLEPTLKKLTTAFNAPIVERDPGVNKFGLHNGIIQLGDCFLEVVAPLPSIDPLKTPGGRYISKYGDGGYMLLMQVDQLNQVENKLKHLQIIYTEGRDQVGHTKINRKHTPGHPIHVTKGSDISITGSHYHPRDMGCIIEATESTPPSEWFWAGSSTHWTSFTKEGCFAKVVIACNEPSKVCNTWHYGLSLIRRDMTKNSLWTEDGSEISFREPLYSSENGPVEIDLWSRTKSLIHVKTTICGVVFGFKQLPSKI